MENTKKEMDEKQGCHIAGSFKVYRVPGNFHISTQAYGDIATMLRMQGYHFDFTHNIRHLSFGNKEDFEYIHNHFQDLFMEHPADGVQNIAQIDKDGNPMG
jgi:hypothetical protein